MNRCYKPQKIFSVKSALMKSRALKLEGVLHRAHGSGVHIADKPGVSISTSCYAVLQALQCTGEVGPNYPPLIYALERLASKEEGGWLKDRIKA